MKPIYLVSGEEWLLVDAATHQILKLAKEAGFLERIIIDAEETGSTDIFHHHYFNISLFTLKKICEVRFSRKISAAWVDTLNTAFKKLNPDTLVILRTLKLTATETKQPWYQAIQQQGHITTLWPIKPEGWRSFVQEQLQKRFHPHRINLLPDTYTQLAHHTTGNLISLHQIIEKLSVLYGKELSDRHVTALLSEDSQYSLWEFCNDFLLKKTALNLKQIAYLKNEPAEAPLLLWALGQDIRILQQLLITPQSEHSKIFQQYKIWPARQVFFKQALSLYTADKLLPLTSKLRQMDAILKGLEPGTLWENLESCILLSHSHT